MSDESGTCGDDTDHVVEQDYECLDCEWDGHGTELKGPNGECPECDSRSVRVVDDD